MRRREWNVRIRDWRRIGKRGSELGPYVQPEAKPVEPFLSHDHVQAIPRGHVRPVFEETSPYVPLRPRWPA